MATQKTFGKRIPAIKAQVNNVPTSPISPAAVLPSAARVRVRPATLTALTAPTGPATQLLTGTSMGYGDLYVMNHASGGVLFPFLVAHTLAKAAGNSLVQTISEANPHPAQNPPLGFFGKLIIYPFLAAIIACVIGTILALIVVGWPFWLFGAVLYYVLRYDANWRAKRLRHDVRASKLGLPAIPQYSCTTQ